MGQHLKADVTGRQKSVHECLLTKDSERCGIKVGSRENGRWPPSITNDLRIVEGRDGIGD